MNAVPILQVRRDWYCPNCDTTDITLRGDVHQQMHHCPGLRGLIAPLLEVGVRGKVVAHEREDYINGDDVQLHEGRPVMSVETVRDEGTDLVVFAPTASAKVDG